MYQLIDLIVFSTDTCNALKKLFPDGSHITITNPLINSEEIYFYHHLKELGYVYVNQLKDRMGVQIGLTDLGILIVVKLKIIK